MRIQRILCPIDFSEFNQSANRYACELAESTGAEIVYYYAHLDDVFGTPRKEFDADKEIKQWTAKLKDFVQPTRTKVKASYVVEFGTPAERIVQYANGNDVDLVVMSTHGRSGLTRMLMGSVAEAVVRRADCPVLAVKTDVKESVEAVESSS